MSMTISRMDDAWKLGVASLQADVAVGKQMKENLDASLSGLYPKVIFLAGSIVGVPALSLLLNKDTGPKQCTTVGDVVRIKAVSFSFASILSVIFILSCSPLRYTFRQIWLERKALIQHIKGLQTAHKIFKHRMNLADTAMELDDILMTKIQFQIEALHPQCYAYWGNIVAVVILAFVIIVYQFFLAWLSLFIPCGEFLMGNKGNSTSSH